MYANRIKQLFIAVMIAAASTQAGAQDLETDLKAIAEKVGAADVYTIASEVKAYSKKGGALLHQMKASVSASKTAVLTIIGEIEILTTESQIISVDREEKLIEVQNAPKSGNSGSPRKKKNSVNLEDLAKLARAESGLVFKLTSTSGNIRTYTASNTKAGIRSIVLKLDFVEKKLISYITEMSDERGNPGQYIVVDYTRFSYTLDNQDSVKVATYITGSGKTLQPAAAFKGYKLIQK